MKFVYDDQTYDSDMYQRADKTGEVPPPPPKLTKEQYAKLSTSDANKYEAIRRYHAQYLIRARAKDRAAKQYADYGSDEPASGVMLDNKNLQMIREGLKAMEDSSQQLQKRLKAIEKEKKDDAEYKLLQSMLKENLELSSRLSRGGLSSAQMNGLFASYKKIDELAMRVDKSLVTADMFKTYAKRWGLENIKSSSAVMSVLNRKLDVDVEDLIKRKPSTALEGSGGLSTGLGTAALGALGPVGMIAGLILNSSGAAGLAEKLGGKAINKFRKYAFGAKYEDDIDAESKNLEQVRTAVQATANSGPEQDDDVETFSRALPEAVEEATERGVESAMQNTAPSIAKLLKETFEQVIPEQQEDLIDAAAEGFVEGIEKELNQLDKQNVMLLQGLDLTGDLIEELTKSGFDESDAAEMARGFAAIVKDNLDRQIEATKAQTETVKQAFESLEPGISYEDQRDLNIRKQKEDVINAEHLQDRQEKYFDGKFGEVLTLLKSMVDGKGAFGKLGGGGGGFFSSLANGAQTLAGGAAIAWLANKTKNLLGMGGKEVEKAGVKLAEKDGAKAGKGLLSLLTKEGAGSALKAGGKEAASLLGKTLGKKIPILGALLGGAFAYNRIKEDNDYVGAGGEALSGLLSTVPVIGTAASLGVDGWLFNRDMQRNKAKESGQKPPSEGSMLLNTVSKISPLGAAGYIGGSLGYWIGKKAGAAYNWATDKLGFNKANAERLAEHLYDHPEDLPKVEAYLRQHPNEAPKYAKMILEAMAAAEQRYGVAMPQNVKDALLAPAAGAMASVADVQFIEPPSGKSVASSSLVGGLTSGLKMASGAMDYLASPGSSVPMSSAMSVSPDDMNRAGLSSRGRVYLAVQDAARRAGVDPKALASMAAVESNFNTSGAGAYNAASGASGTFQFIDSTWKDMLSKYGGKYGIDYKSLSPQQVQQMKFDPTVNSLMGAEYMKENARSIGSNDPGNLYLAHFLGAGGAAAVLRNPQAPLSQILPNYDAVVKANPHMRSMRTGQDVIDWARSVMQNKGAVADKLGMEVTQQLASTSGPASGKGMAQAVAPDSMYPGPAPIPSAAPVMPMPQDSAAPVNSALPQQSNKSTAFTPTLNDAFFMFDDPGMMLVNTGAV